MILKTSVALPTIALLLSCPLTQLNAGTLIYQDTFTGSGANPLNGTTPDVTPGGETWTASGQWREDGTKPTTGNGSAWLPFSPEPGTIYRLSVDVNPSTSGSSDWLAMGFAQGNNTADPFHNGGNAAGPWGLVRENDVGSMIQTFRGPITGFAQGYDPGPDIIGPVHFSIELDTTRTNWSAEWYINGQLIRSNLNIFSPTNPNITHIGIGGYRNADGAVGTFMLAEIGKPVPEPSTGFIVVIGTILLSFRRRLLREWSSRR